MKYAAAKTESTRIFGQDVRAFRVLGVEMHFPWSMFKSKGKGACKGRFESVIASDTEIGLSRNKDAVDSSQGLQ